MKAARFKNRKDIQIENAEKPVIQNPTDAIVKVNLTTICGTDLHMYHGIVPFEKDHILGHEFVGYVEELGAAVNTIKKGDRIVGTSTIACGYCFYCRMGLYGQCDNATEEKSAAYFGGPPRAGNYNGAQAEYIRVPYADVVLYKLPDEITDEQALIMSDILPTGYFGAEMAEIKPGESVVVYGAGPVGLMAGLSAKIMGASHIFMVDEVDLRLKMAEEHLNAITINSSKTNPVKEIMKLTNNSGVDKAIEAVGMEAHSDIIEALSEVVGLEQNIGITVRQSIKSVRKCGVVSIIGAFSGNINNFPIGDVMGKNITIKAGVCHHRRYMDILARLIRTGQVDPTFVFTHKYTLDDIGEAYKTFDKEKDKCVKEIITV